MKQSLLKFSYLKIIINTTYIATWTINTAVDHLRGSRSAQQGSLAALSFVMRSGGFAIRLDRDVYILEQGQRYKQVEILAGNKKTIITYMCIELHRK